MCHFGLLENLRIYSRMEMHKQPQTLGSLRVICHVKIYCINCHQLTGADPGFPVGGGANCPGGRQHTILPNFPKNCMKLKEFGSRGARVPRPSLRSATAFGSLRVICHVSFYCINAHQVR